MVCTVSFLPSSVRPYPLVSHTLSYVMLTEGLVLLTHLAHSNQEIQKIVAFEGAFEKLFFVIDSEVRTAPPTPVSATLLCLPAIQPLFLLMLSREGLKVESSSKMH